MKLDKMDRRSLNNFTEFSKFMFGVFQEDLRNKKKAVEEISGRQGKRFLKENLEAK